VLHGTIRDVPSFIVNFRFPWGVLVLAFAIPSKYVLFLEYRNNANHKGGSSDSAKKPQQQQTSSTPPAIPSSFAPAERRAARFLMSSDVDIAASLKLIPVATEGPWLVRNLVTGTPMMIGTKVKTRVFRGAGETATKPADPSESSSTVTSNISSSSSQDSHSSSPQPHQSQPPRTPRAPYLELDLDIGDSIKPRAKKIVSTCRTHMTTLNCNIGFVVQSDTDSPDELPEQMMAGLSLNRIDPHNAPRYPSSSDTININSTTYL
jgi:hypothetical protein